MKKNITIIINPAAGKKDSILWSINNAFHKTDINWEVQITQKRGEAYDFALEATKKNQHLVAVYGGDGTVAEVAKALYKSQTSLFIIPGGTNNIFAKELELPLDIDQSLDLLTRHKHKIRSIDMALFRNEPFALRIETGILAQMVKNTKRKSKRLLGQLSYPFHLFAHLHKPMMQTFKMRIDDKDITQSGVALMIANVGNIGIQGYSILPHCGVNDGFLDIILFREKSFTSFFVWLKSILTHQNPQELIHHWKAKKVYVTLDKEQTIICDDHVVQTKTIEVEISPHSLNVVVP